MVTGTAAPEAGNQDRATLDQVLSWSAEINVPGVEGLIRAIERILQDFELGELQSSVVDKLRSWQRLVDLAERTPGSLQAIHHLVLSLLLILTHNTSPRTQRYISRAISTLKPVAIPGMDGDEARTLLGRYPAPTADESDIIERIGRLVAENITGKKLAEMLRSETAPPKEALLSARERARFDPTRDEIVETALHRLWLDIKLSREPFPVGSLGSVLWALGTSLEAVGGVASNVEYVSSGSVVVGVGLYVSSVFRLDDVFEILERAFRRIEGSQSGNAAGQEMDDGQEEGALLEAARREVQSRQETVTGLADSIGASELAGLTEYDIQDRKLEVAKRELELQLMAYQVEQMRLDTAGKRAEALGRISNLLADAVLEVDTAEFILEGYPIFTMVERNVHVGSADTAKAQLREIRGRELGQHGSGSETAQPPA